MNLDPCPFCGQQVKVRIVSINAGMDGSYKDKQVYCPNCGISMNFAADNFYGREIDTDKAIEERWNRRNEPRQSN